MLEHLIRCPLCRGSTLNHQGGRIRDQVQAEPVQVLEIGDVSARLTCPACDLVFSVNLNSLGRVLREVDVGILHAGRHEAALSDATWFARAKAVSTGELDEGDLGNDEFVVRDFADHLLAAVNQKRKARVEKRKARTSPREPERDQQAAEAVVVRSVVPPIPPLS